MTSRSQAKISRRSFAGMCIGAAGTSANAFDLLSRKDRCSINPPLDPKRHH